MGRGVGPRAMGHGNGRPRETANNFSKMTPFISEKIFSIFATLRYTTSSDTLSSLWNKHHLIL